MKKTISFEQASEAVAYDSETGEMRWLRKPNKRLPIGAKAGTRCNGYLVVRINGENYYCHRLAWLLHYGQHPEFQLDHINGDKADNRILNLRAADGSLNHENIRKPRRHNRTGRLGVNQTGNRFVARIGVKGKMVNLGSYTNVDDAAIAYLSAKRLLHSGCTI